VPGPSAVALDPDHGSRPGRTARSTRSSRAGGSSRRQARQGTNVGVYAKKDDGSWEAASSGRRAGEARQEGLPHDQPTGEATSSLRRGPEHRGYAEATELLFMNAVLRARRTEDRPEPILTGGSSDKVSVTTRAVAPLGAGVMGEVYRVRDGPRRIRFVLTWRPPRARASSGLETTSRCPWAPAWPRGLGARGGSDALFRLGGRPGWPRSRSDARARALAAAAAWGLPHGGYPERGGEGPAPYALLRPGTTRRLDRPRPGVAVGCRRRRAGAGRRGSLRA